MTPIEYVYPFVLFHALLVRIPPASTIIVIEFSSSDLSLYQRDCSASVSKCFFLLLFHSRHVAHASTAIAIHCFHFAIIVESEKESRIVYYVFASEPIIHGTVSVSFVYPCIRLMLCILFLVISAWRRGMKKQRFFLCFCKSVVVATVRAPGRHKSFRLLGHSWWRCWKKKEMQHVFFSFSFKAMELPTTSVPAIVGQLPRM